VSLFEAAKGEQQIGEGLRALSGIQEIIIKLGQGIAPVKVLLGQQPIAAIREISQKSSQILRGFLNPLALVHSFSLPGALKKGHNTCGAAWKASAEGRVP